MKIQTIQFQKEGHDFFLDFIKAYAIIGVLICHTIFFINKIPGYGIFWGIDVPLFLLVQTFHFYKRDNTKLNLSKIFNRVFLPFLIVQAVILIISCFIDYQEVVDNWQGWIKGFGKGPGSYYPLIYLQISLLLLFFRKPIKKLSKWKLLLLFLLISEGLEIICSFLHPSAGAYRLLVFRYVFLIYLGWLWVSEGVIVNWKMIVLSVLSILSIIYFQYYNDKFGGIEPLFFNSSWKLAKWPCYYWISNGLICILFAIWNMFKKNAIINSIIAVLAKSSWEIYLMQMASIYLIKVSYIGIDNKYLNYIVYLVVVWTLSIGGGILLNKFFSKKLYKKSVR
jgi:hypothetical protein